MLNTDFRQLFVFLFLSQMIMALMLPVGGGFEPLAEPGDARERVWTESFDAESDEAAGAPGAVIPLCGSSALLRPAGCAGPRLTGQSYFSLAYHPAPRSPPHLA